MDKNDYSEAYITNSPCKDCIHNHINNGEGILGCRAFPDGIPQKAKYTNGHLKPIKGQVGDYVFKEAKFEELSPVGKYFWGVRHRK